MPKVSDIDLISRISNVIESLQSNERMVRRDIEAVLTDEQLANADANWISQQDLRKKRLSKEHIKQQVNRPGIAGGSNS